MSFAVARYVFRSEVPLAEVKASLVMALLTIEVLYGEATAQFSVNHAWDEGSRRCVIDARTRPGRLLNRLFLGYVIRQFGPDSFQMERLQQPPAKAGA